MISNVCFCFRFTWGLKWWENIIWCPMDEYIYIYTNCWIFLELSMFEQTEVTAQSTNQVQKCNYYYVFWFDEPQVQLRIKLQVLTRLSNHLIRWTILITQHCNTKNAANLVGRSLSNLPWRNPWWNRMGWTLTVRKQVSSTSSDPLAAATLAEAAFYIHAKTMSVSVFVFHEAGIRGGHASFDLHSIWKN
jgi:hypothetical protein